MYSKFRVLHFLVVHPSVRPSIHPSIHPILVNAMSQQCLKRIFVRYLPGLKDELIRFRWSMVKVTVTSHLLHSRGCHTSVSVLLSVSGVERGT